MNNNTDSRDGAVSLLPLYEAEALEKEASKHYEKKDFDKSAELYRQALEIRKRCCGDKDPNNARLLDEIGLALLSRHLPASAAVAFKQAQDLLEDVYYAGHGELAPVLEHHSDALIAQGKLAEAEQALKRAQEIYAKTVTMENRNTLRAILKLARLYLALHQPEHAEAVLEKGMKHVDTPLGPVAEFRYQLALAYIQEGRVDQADRLLDLCVDQFKQRHNYGRVVDCMELQQRVSGGIVSDAEAEKYRKLRQMYHYPDDIFLATLLRA